MQDKYGIIDGGRISILDLVLFRLCHQEENRSFLTIFWRRKETEEGNQGEKRRENCKETRKLCFSMRIHMLFRLFDFVEETSKEFYPVNNE